MRPRFHFTAESGWINDPHGITVKDGAYHLFFQYVPDSTVWAPNCHWGHAAGPDLFSLRELPVALAPGDGDDGIWTGSLVTDRAGRTSAFYTSTTQPDIGIGRIRTAEPLDADWVRWKKGVIVADAPSDLGLIAYRDPFVVRDEGCWRMFVGGASADGRAMALSYTSEDLSEWSYEGIALQRSTSERMPVWMGALWECPQIIEVDGRWVMVSSVWDDDVLYYSGYAIGSYADGHFEAETWGRLSYGGSYYAPSFFRDADGRPCLTFWMRGIDDLEAGWAGAHSVPHVLSLEGDMLVAGPHPDLGAHRVPVAAGGEIHGLAADILWSPEEGAALTIASGGESLHLRRQSDRIVVEAPDGTQYLPYDGTTLRVVLDAQAVEISGSAGVLGLAWRPEGQGISVRGEGVEAMFGLDR